MKTFYLLCCIGLLSISAFGSSMPMPPDAGGSIELSTSLLDKKATNGAKKIGDSPFYYNQTQGGSLVLGLLGPIGVLANAALVDNKRSNEAKSDVLRQNIDIYTLVQASINSSQPQAEISQPKVSSSNTFFVEPFVLLQSRKSGEITTSLVYLVALKNGNDLVWREKYYYHLNKKFPKDVLANGDGTEFKEYLISSIPVAVAALSEFVISDITKTIPSSAEVKVKSDYFGWLPGPFNASLLSNNDGTSKFRINGNDAFENMYARGMHIFNNSDAETQ